MTEPAFLAGVRVIEVTLLGPSAVGMHFADLGADVIKVEDPAGGDYLREVGRRTGEAASPLHRQWNRGKRSVALDLRKPDGAADFLKLVASADILIEGMRPGALARRGFSFERLRAVKPDLVMISVSGFGQTGPYAELPSHGPAFEAYAGLAPPAFDEKGRPRVPTANVGVGVTVAAMYAVMAGLAALTRARASGEPAYIDVSQADAAVYFNAIKINAAAEARARKDAGLEPLVGGYGMQKAGDELFSDSVLVQYYRTADDRYVLFQAMEKKFYENFLRHIGRLDLIPEFPADKHIDHLYGNDRMRAVFAAIFATRPLAAWMEVFTAADVPGVPVNSIEEVREDPHFKTRARWLDAATHGAPMLGFPAHAEGGLPDPRPAPRLGEHGEEVLGGVED